MTQQTPSNSPLSGGEKENTSLDKGRMGGVLISSLQELQEFAAEVTRNLREGDVLLLSGPLGAGKTAFTQALARALGISEKVNSPTFTIVAEYGLPAGRQEFHHHESIKTLVHADLYRLTEESAPFDLAVQDVLQRASETGRLTIIEWAERLGNPTSLKLRGARWIYFDYGSTESERLVSWA